MFSSSNECLSTSSQTQNLSTALSAMTKHFSSCQLSQLLARSLNPYRHSFEVRACESVDWNQIRRRSGSAVCVIIADTSFATDVCMCVGPVCMYVCMYVVGREYAVLIGISSMVVMLGNLFCCNNNNTQHTQQRHRDHMGSAHDHKSKSLVKVQADTPAKQFFADVAVDEDGAVKAAMAAEQQVDPTANATESPESTAVVVAADANQSTRDSTTLALGVGRHDTDCRDPPAACSSSSIITRTGTGPGGAVTGVDHSSKVLPVDRVLPLAIADADEENEVEVVDNNSNSSSNDVVGADLATHEVAEAPQRDQFDTPSQAQIQNIEEFEAPPRTTSSVEVDAVNHADRNDARVFVGAAALAAALRLNQVGLEALYRVPRHRWDWPMYAAVGYLAWKLR